MFPFAIPCPSEGCENAMRPDQQVCGSCAIRIANAMRREDARWTMYAYEGIRELGRYLAKWAAFDAWCVPRHPPV